MALTQISTDGVKNDAVTAGKIPANAVGSSEIAANAVGTSEIAADAVTQAQIAGESVDEAKMIISNAGSNGQFLQKQSGNTGGLTWATPTDNTVGGATGVDFNDTVKARWGTGNDLSIYHDGDHNRIDSSNGNIYLRHGTDNAIMTVPDGLVALYHDDVKRLETLDDGVEVVGHLHLGDNNQIRLGYPTSPGDGDLKLYHDGTDSYITNDTGNLYIKQGADTILMGVQNGATSLRYDGSTKFETTSSGVGITGTLTRGNGIIDIYDSNTDTTITNGVTNGDIVFNAVVASQGTVPVLRLGNGDASGAVLIPNDFGKLKLGASGDLQIYHNGTINVIDAQVGNLEIRHGAEKMIACANDGQVELYYDGSKMLETVSTGAKVSGKLEVTDDLNLTGASYNALWDKSANQFKVNDSASIALGNDADCKMYHDGGSTWILNNLGHFYIRNNVDGDDGSNIYIQAKSGEGSLYCIHDGAVELYYDGTKKFETLSTGAHIATDADLRFANGTWTGDTAGKIQHHGNSLYIQGGSNGFIFRSSGGVDRWRIDADGHWVPQSNNSYDIGTSSYRVKNLYVNDAHFSNKGSQNSVDGTWGDWTLQEGEDDIFMLNNRTGKKYKMALQEVS